jgi:hypothetical protein
MMVLFAKIIPKNVEATCFAFLTGTINLMGTLSGIIGAWINEKFVGVTQEDMSGYWKLLAIMYTTSLIPILFLSLIPSRKEIEALQERINPKIKEIELDKSDTSLVDLDKSNNSI